VAFNHSWYRRLGKVFNKIMEKDLTQEEKELLVLKQVLNVLQTIELSWISMETFEKLVYAKGLLQGFINLKGKSNVEIKKA
jgi:hypothetical protein